MALALLLFFIFVMMWLGKKGKATRLQARYEKLSAAEKKDVEAERKCKKKEIDEQITVILPTIQHK